MKQVLIDCMCGCGNKLSKYDKYGRTRKYLLGHNGRKYKDSSQYKREWNYRNREHRYEYKRKYISERKLKLINILGGKCKCCGINATLDNLAIFDFHHKNSKEKMFNLGQNTIGNKSYESILKEAQKCDVLCSNCHRIYHFKENKNGKTRNL